MPDIFLENLAQITRQPYFHILLAVAVFLLFLCFSRALTRLLSFAAKHLAAKTHNKWDDEMVPSFQNPLRVFFILTGLMIACRLIPAFYMSKTYWPAAIKVYRCGLVAIVAWGLYNLEDSGKLFAAVLVKKLDLQINNVLLPFLSKILRFITLAIAVLIIAQEWNFSISGLLAGLGLGGLAFALAAKDMLSNMFSGMVILIDHPFSMGDWIEASGVEGTVEDISFRSVKVRNFSHALVTIPNSSIVGGVVTNWSRMGRRKVSCKIHLGLRTKPEQIRACVKSIRRMLLDNPEIVAKTVAVSFDRFDENGLEILICYFTKATVWKEYLRVKEKVNFAMLDIFEREGVQLTPSSSDQADPNG